MKYSVVTLDKNHNKLISASFDDFFEAMSFMSNKKQYSESYFQVIETETNRIVVSSRVI